VRIKEFVRESAAKWSRGPSRNVVGTGPMSASVVTKELCPESLLENPRNIMRARRVLVGGELCHGR
jgi:hypothetical protein